MRSFVVTKSILTACALALSACATAPDSGKSNSTANQDKPKLLLPHKELAILPFEIIIYEETPLTKNPSSDVGLVVQRQLYSEYMERWERGEYTVKFQDIDQTNLLLRRANMFDGNIKNFTKSEIGAALGVEAFIAGDINYSRPERKRSGLSSAVLNAATGSDKSITVNMAIYESESGDVTWAYSKDLYKMSGPTTEHSAKSLAKASSKKLPYMKLVIEVDSTN